ncbi:uncharacterized protein EV420DRAFT_305096 [Desarmillaria tabescens]|uniref:Uncharacterized protein n=1 Tax=Armillaria tabescens TaxID=1929756 RepID=A0AA39KDF5_ARMTA|nr:uncharacterized protein EV420DRAFT_305096 [Desarmillaria tabescens]KAK0459141.1 hypothetical protein EV420DRAFT_305096 [Desarmillaria tabescens]
MASADDEKVVVETLTAYLNGLALEALVHGMYTALFGVTLWYIFVNPTIRVPKSHTSMMLIPVVLMYLFTTLNLGIRWSWMRPPLVFSQRDMQTGTLFYTFGNADDTTLWAISGAATGANILVADSILTWRCWVVWGRRWPMVVLPILLTVSGTAFDGLFIYHNATDKYSSDGAIWGPAVKWGVIFYSMSLATMVYCTALIIFRILAHREQYWSVIEVVVESAVMYALALVVFIGFLATDDVGGFYPKALLDTVAGIAPTLIVVRVALGQARSDESWQTKETSSSLHFESSVCTVTAMEEAVCESCSSCGQKLVRRRSAG